MICLLTSRLELQIPPTLKKYFLPYFKMTPLFSSFEFNFNWFIDFKMLYFYRKKLGCMPLDDEGVNGMSA